MKTSCTFSLIAALAEMQYKASRGLLKPLVIRLKMLSKTVFVECLCLNPC